MKQFYFKLLAVMILLIAIISVLNINVTTKQGINFQVHEIRLPLYLKILDFVDRHYNYKNIVKNILNGTKDENSKALKIFDWITSNVQKNPKELPIIDDHPLNVLIRGYGTEDQFEDIFTILCTYAGMDAFPKMFQDKSGNVYYISFVKIGGKWRPLSVFGCAYAVKDDLIASVDDILLDKNLMAPFSSKINNFESDSFLKEIKGMDFKAWSVRTNGQSPLGRALCIIKNKFYHK